MDRAAIAIAVALSLTAPAAAQVIPSIAESFPAGLPPGVRSYDLVVDIAEGDGLPRYSVSGETLRGSFVDPDPAQGIFQTGGLLADTWFTSISAPPNRPVPGGANVALPVITPAVGPTSLIAAIFNFGVNPGEGRFIIARILTEHDTLFALRVGLSTVQNPAVREVMLIIPGPGQLAAFAVAAVFAARRRR